MVDRDINPKQMDSQSRPEQPLNLLSILDGVEKNAVAPAVNSFAIQPLDAGINVINAVCQASTCVVDKLAHADFRAPQLAKLSGLELEAAQRGSLAFYSQQIFGMGGSFLAYAAAGKLAGEALDSGSQLIPLNLQVADLNLGASVRGFAQDARVAQITGATAYSALKDPNNGESRLSNALSTFVGFSAFEAGNSFLSPRASALSQFGQRYAVGMFGGVAQTEVSSLIQNGSFADQDAFQSSALSGGLLNALLPVGAKITDGAVARFTGIRGDLGAAPNVEAMRQAKFSFGTGDFPLEQTGSIAPGAAIKSTAADWQPVAPLEQPAGSSDAPVKVSLAAEMPPNTVSLDGSAGPFATMDAANQRIIISEPGGTQKVVSVSPADMALSPGSRQVADDMWRSADGKTTWYKAADGSMTKADDSDYSLRYGPEGLFINNRQSWIHIDNNAHRSMLVDGQNWDGTSNPELWTKPDGSTFRLTPVNADVSTMHWRLADGSERFMDAHSAQWFKGKGQPWREVGTWDSHSNYQHLDNADKWTDGDNVLFRDKEGRYWQGTGKGPYESEDGRSKLLANGTIEPIRSADVMQPQASPAVMRQLSDLQAAQTRLQELPVDSASITPLKDGGMGHEAYALNLIGPEGPQRTIFRAVDTSEQPGLANTRMRKDLAAQDLSARLFEAFPAGAERSIEINGVMRKGWLQDASVFSDQRNALDLQNQLQDLSAAAFPAQPAGAQRLNDFLSGKSQDRSLSIKGMQIKEALEQVLVERMIFGDMDNHSLNFVADFKANPPVIRHIDLDKAFRVHATEPSLALNDLNESGLDQITQVFSNAKLSANTRARINEFLDSYDSPAGRRQMASQGLLGYPPEVSSVISRARWLKDHGTFPPITKLFGPKLSF